jgi:hypothetical protein
LPALDVASGFVIGKCYKRHRAAEFLNFLKEIDAQVPGLAFARSGSNNDKAVYQELGTQHIPARSFLAQAVCLHPRSAY